MPDAREVESVLREHVLDAWFPRSIDRTHGGFLCDFDRAWKECGPHDKLLEFQARQTLMAADASRAYPGDQRFRDAALHGLKCLREMMWDNDDGGWYHRVDRSGKPLESHTKHAHGMAYTIEACAAVYKATGVAEALEHAREGFEWLDRHARDHEHGGYFGFLKRDGTIIREPAQCPYKTEVDTVGTPIGLKDINVHSDLLETFVYLYEVWPSPVVRERVLEGIDIVARRLYIPFAGGLHFFVTPDWIPVPHLIRSGYQFQSAFRLTTAFGVANDPEALRRIALALTDCALKRLWDRRHGGFVYGAPSIPPMALNGQDVRLTFKSWWPQVEALRTLLAASHLTADGAPYHAGFERQWEYLRRSFVDDEYGGVYTSGLDGAGRIRRRLGVRFAPPAVTRKGDVWKDASHEGRALLYCVETLRAEEGATARPGSPASAAGRSPS